MGTQFSAVYNRFLGKITDDMYMELTPEDTIKDLQNLIVNALPGFEFPRKDLYNYEIKTCIMREDELIKDDFVLGVIWGEIPDANAVPDVLVDKSSFFEDLTSEEINIIAILMMEGWLQRQVTSCENIRMKYSGSDFKMTSQANHLSKLLSLLKDCQRQSIHMQRLYKRRRFSSTGKYESNWSVLGEKNAIE